MMRSAGGSNWARNVAWRPCAEVSDAGLCYELRMSVQGVQADRLSVEIRDEVLIVRGRVDPGPFSRRKEESEFHRLVGLPPDAARTGATARLEGELLVVRIPKARIASGARLDLMRTDDDRGGQQDVQDDG